MNLYEKIANVMKDVSYLQKDDNIQFNTTKYKAISEEKVTSTVRESLIKNGLVILPVNQDHRREGTLTTVDVTYRIQNIEKPEEYIEVVSSGTGADTQDKGVGKAMTYAYKYMLLRTFAIPTGEDPEKTSSAELDAKFKRADTSQRDLSQHLTKDELNDLFRPIAKDTVACKKILKDLGVSKSGDITRDMYDRAEALVSAHIINKGGAA